MTAKPGYQRLYIYRGDPFEVTFSSSVDDEAESVVALDALAQIRATPDSEDVLAEFAVEVSGADDNIVTLSLTAEDTAALPPGTLRWDFQPNPDSETWLVGPVHVDADVSRP